jgi:flavin-dependent dehydrogenase
MKGRFKKVAKESNSGDLDWVWSIHAEVNGETIVLRAKWIIDATGRKASLATKVRRAGTHNCRIL